MAKIKIKKDDMFRLLLVRSKGLKGKVLKLFLKRIKLSLKGVNMVSKHTKPNAANPQGGIVKQESSIHISKSQLC